MQNAFNAVGCILLLALAGAGVYLLGWVRDGHLPLLSALVIKVALPGMIVDNVLGQYTPESLLANLPALAAAFISVILTLLLALPLGRLLKLPRRRLGVFAVMFAFSNSVFVGVPVSRALFGEAVIPYTLLYYIANTSLFWGVGFPLMRKWGGAAAGKRRTPPAPLLVIFACFVLVFLRFQPPKFVMDAAGYLGNLVTPLSLLFTGAVMARMVRARTFRWGEGLSGRHAGALCRLPGTAAPVRAALPAARHGARCIDGAGRHASDDADGAGGRLHRLGRGIRRRRHGIDHRPVAPDDPPVHAAHRKCAVSAG